MVSHTWLGACAAIVTLCAAPAAAQESGHAHHATTAEPTVAAPQGTPPSPPATAQTHEGHAMPGMDHGDETAPQAHDGDHSAHGAAAGESTASENAPGKSAAGGEAAQDHSAHAGHGAAPENADEIGNAAPPQVVPANAADRFFSPERMAEARAALSREGRFFGSAVLVDWLEYRAVRGQDGYAWEGEGWIGGDIDRLAIATEGEGTFGEALESAEVRAAWRHAIDPYFNLEAGVRQDFGPGPDRTYASIGIDGLAPFWFDVEANLFVSTKGDVHLRAEGSYDLRITNRLILQPAAEVEAAMQDVPELGIGAGLSRIELGVRLRYQVTRQFAPYVGVHWDRALGQTAAIARADGERTGATSAVFGVRAWF